MRAKRYAYCDDRHSTMRAVEVITSVERRRRWSREEKLRIVAESAQAGRTASQVARDHGIAPGQLFIWRRQLLAEAIANGAAADGFSAAASSDASANERRALPAHLPSRDVVHAPSCTCPVCG